MNSNIPLPTDNIYKFYALFGLLLVISSILATIYVSNQIFSSGLNLVKQYEEIKQLTPEETPLTISLIENQLKNLGANKNTQLQILGGIIGLGLALMIYGFWHWHHKIQPKHDKLLDLQIQKLEKELQ